MSETTISGFPDWELVYTNGDVLKVYGVAGERLGIYREDAAPGRSGPRHLHERTEEILLVTEGEVDFTVGDEKRTLGPGEVAHVPPGTWHELYTENGATYYLLFSPGQAHGDFVLADPDGPGF